MKILFVSSCFPSKDLPQYGIFVYQLAKELKRQGCDVDILNLDGNNNENIDYKGFKIFNFKNYASKIQMMFALKNHRNSESIKNFISKNNYDLFCIHFANYSSISSLASILKKQNKHSAMYLHGLNVFEDIDAKHKLVNKVLGFMKKKYYKKIDSFVCVSKMTQDKLLQKLPNANSYVIYNGVDPSIFKPPVHYEKKLKIISIGNLFPLKGHRYIIEAIKTLREKYNIDATLDIYGRGCEYTKLQNQIDNYCLRDVVHLNGYVNYDDLANKMRDYSIFILPSYFEAFGCVFLEAMSEGLITIGCKNQGNAEFMIDSVNSFLVDEKDADSIVETILKIKEREDLNSIRSNAINTAQKMTWQASASKFLECFGNGE